MFTPFAFRSIRVEEAPIPGVWSPADFTNVQAWWKADAGITLDATYPWKVGRWEDQINGYFVTQSFTSGTYPNVDRMPSTGSSANLNNQDTVHFEISTPSGFPAGAPNYMYTTGSWPSIAGSDFTMLMVLDYVAPYANNEGPLIGMIDGTSVKRFWFDSFASPNDLRIVTGLGAASIQTIDTNQLISNNAAYVMGQYYEQSAGDTYYYLNSTTGSLAYNGTVTGDTFANTTLFGMGGFLVGTSNVGSLNIVRANDFHIGEVVLIKGIPSASELSEWQNYVNTKYGNIILDGDASAFITAAGITDNTQKNAINNLVLDLKSNGLWTKMQAVYPFVGGTATSHKFNLINPQDTDAAFRLGFSGTITHDSNGITPNGTTGYATTYMDLQALGGGTDDGHFAMYVRTLAARAGTDLGANNGTSYMFFNARNTSNLMVYTLNTNSTSSTVSFSGTTGFFGGSRLNSSTQVATINTTQTSASRTSVSTTGNTRDIFVGAYNNNGTTANFQNRNYALLTLGYGLSDSEMDTLASINQTFQTALGRFV